MTYIYSLYAMFQISFKFTNPFTSVCPHTVIWCKSQVENSIKYWWFVTNVQLDISVELFWNWSIGLGGEFVCRKMKTDRSRLRTVSDYYSSSHTSCLDELIKHLAEHIITSFINRHCYPFYQLPQQHFRLLQMNMLMVLTHAHGYQPAVSPTLRSLEF